MFYTFATVGARTERGGCITSGSASTYRGLPIARVGDVVTYCDGSEAVIMDGAGFAALFDHRPVALVGSSLSNGDRVVSTIWEGAGIFVAEGTKIEGLFDPAYISPPPELLHRFAVRGSTTARGGVLKEVTSGYYAEGTHSVGRIGDYVEYADGSRARIITGVGIPGDLNHTYGIVGSLLDNGDVINDSPHRDVRTSTSFVPVDEHGVALLLQ